MYQLSRVDLESGFLLSVRTCAVLELMQQGHDFALYKWHRFVAFVRLPEVHTPDLTPLQPGGQAVLILLGE